MMAGHFQELVSRFTTASVEAHFDNRGQPLAAGRQRRRLVADSGVRRFELTQAARTDEICAGERAWSQQIMLMDGLYVGLNRFEAGKPLGTSRPAPARRPSQSRQSAQARERPSAVVQAAPSAAAKSRPSRRPPSR